eukprot:scaffold56550_cov69-Phaeocystis_antarctica.AAC.2
MARLRLRHADVAARCRGRPLIILVGRNARTAIGNRYSPRPPTHPHPPSVPFPVARGATSPTTAPLAHHNVFTRVRSESAPLSASRACNTACALPKARRPPPPYRTRFPVLSTSSHTLCSACRSLTPYTLCWVLDT